MLEKEHRRIVHEGNGTSVQFPFDFRIESLSTIVVSTYDPATESLVELAPAEYQVFGLGNPNGGYVVYSPVAGPLPAGMRLIIERTVPYQQHTELLNQGGFFPKAVEAGLDHIVMQTQQLADDLRRSIKVGPQTDTPDVLTTDLEPGKYLKVNPTGDGITMGTFAEDELEGLVEHATEEADRAEREADRAETYVDAISNVVDGTSQEVKRFSGDGATISFNLGIPDITEKQIIVFFSGVYQQRDTYSVAGGVVTFVEAPPAGAGNVEFLLNPAVVMAQATPMVGSVVGLSLSDNPADLSDITQKLSGVRYVEQSLTAGQQAQARANLGLGDAATRSVGTTPGSVAAGDDSRIVNAVGTDDPRLSDARDWVAGVVSEGEARAGTSTEPRKWTAERVQQAIESLSPSSPVGMYTGSDRDEVDFPIGHHVFLRVDGIPDRNALKRVTLGPSPGYYGDAASEVPLSGVWRARGADIMFINRVCLAQRVA